MSGDEVLTDVQYVTGSPQRPAVLAAVCQSPRRPTALTEDVDATRTTVQRILAGFLERGWVRKRDGEYAATPTGRRVLAAYEELADAVAVGQRLAPVAELLSDLDPAPPDAALADVEVTVAESGAPMAPIDRFVAWFGAREDEHVRVAAPTFSRSLTAALRDVASESVGTSIVLAEAPTDEACGDGAPSTNETGGEGPPSTDETGGDGAPPTDEAGGEDSAAIGRDAMASMDVDVAVYPGAMPAGVAVGASSVCLLLHDADGAIAATLVGTDPALFEWARDRYGAYASAARPLGGSENGGTDPKERVQR